MVGMATKPLYPQAFIWRRLHSLSGLFFALFLIEHLLVNSQAALFVGDDGAGFVRAVNAIHDLPYLPFIEFFLLGVPIVIHMVWGIVYLRTAQMSTFRNDGTVAYLPQYSRNQAYSWQRITSWILLVGVIAHVVQMRFVDYPTSIKVGSHTHYILPLKADDGLYPLAARLDVTLYDQNQMTSKIDPTKSLEHKSEDEWSTLHSFLSSFTDIFQNTKQHNTDHAIQMQELQQREAWEAALKNRPLKEGEVMAVAPDFGTAELLIVRETFKMPLMIFFYTLFVLSACFHGFNGLWTFMISWGVTLSPRSQNWMQAVSIFLMLFISFLGLSAIWGTYLINLKQ
jgi:succinate dehydrogenase / fumarate reductase cytochrome b subunit